MAIILALARDMSSTPSYYAPFLVNSGVIPDNSSSDSESDSDSSIGFTDSAAKYLDDPRYAIIRAAGPNLNTFPQQYFYHMGLGAPYNDEDNYDPSQTIALPIPLLPFKPSNTSTTSSLFAFGSDDRDRGAYPLSTFFKIKTPRTYKDITQIQLVSINFPMFLNSLPDASSVFIDIAKYASSNTQFTFSNCYACLGNAGYGRGIATSLNGGSFSEIGRVNPVAPSKPLVHTFTLRGGAYEGGAMANEMDKQLNTTPPFNMMSYTEHRQLFVANGNANHLFNDPGKWYYCLSSGMHVRNASKSLIISDYLPNTILQEVQPTEKEIFVAYFFPVLRAALYSDYDCKFLQIESDSLASVKQRVLNSFEGLASPLYYELCYNNLATLKSIRRVHTFEYNPINRYNYSYNPTDHRVSVTHTDLHPSLQQDIQSYYETSKQKMATALGLSGRDVTQLHQKIQQTGGIVSDLSRQIHSALVEVGVPLHTYTDSQIADPATPILMQTKKSLNPQQTTESDDALIALTLGAPPSLSPPAIIKRSFPASFGWSTMQQLVQDASAVSVMSSGTRAYTVPYMQHVQNLNKMTSNNFSALYSTFINYYSTNTGLVSTASSIQSKGLALTSNYVNTKYSSVLPPSLLQNNNYLSGKGTGGVTFYASRNIHYPSTPDDTDDRSLNFISDSSGGCCGFISATIQNFYGCLPAEYVINTPFYKLGFGINDILSFYSTNTLSTTTFRNNIYLQLNEEYSLNNMDVANPENRNISNETTGEHKKVFGRILTQGLKSGDTAQTIVQVPAKFPIAPLGSLDHFSFNFLLDSLVPLSKLYPFTSAETDWTGVMQIDEQVSVFTQPE